MTRGVQSARQVLDRAMSEDELLTAIVEAALMFGWCVHHDRRSDKALQQGSPGFPDLVLAKGGRVIFAELKSDDGRLTRSQWVWHDAIGDHYFIWRSADLDAALRELR